MEASGKMSRTTPTAVLISCAPPSQSWLYVTVNFGVGLGRARLIAVFDSHVLSEAVSIVRFRSILQFMILLFCSVLFAAGLEGLQMVLILDNTSIDTSAAIVGFCFVFGIDK